MKNRHTPNGDLAWRERYASAYQDAARDGLDAPSARERASREAWQDYERRTGQPAQFRNGMPYYVWVLRQGSDEPMSEGPYGPYDDFLQAKTFARIGATEGAHDRVVSRGLDPKARAFEILRRYRAGTGERLV